MAKEGVDSAYLSYYLNNSSFIKNSLVFLKQGGTRFALSFNRFSTLKVHIPDINEQYKITSLITSLDNLIVAKQHQIAKAKQWKKGLMQRLFI